MRPIAKKAQSRDERGAITLLFVLLAVAFFGVISLVAEGGRKLENLGIAEDLAAEAARSAAATLDLDEVAQGNAVIDEARAEAAAEEIVATNSSASIVEMSVSPESVFVAVEVSGSSFLPGFSINGVGSHRAAALDLEATP